MEFEQAQISHKLAVKRSTQANTSFMFSFDQGFTQGFFLLKANTAQACHHFENGSKGLVRQIIFLCICSILLCCSRINVDSSTEMQLSLFSLPVISSSKLRFVFTAFLRSQSLGL